MPHDLVEEICPTTGKPLRRRIERTPGASRPSRPPRQPVQMSVATPFPRGDLNGQVIADKYRIRSVLGQGGMGTVFEAERLTLGGAVAIKVLHPDRARDAKAVRRFHKEARTAAAMGHPNICEVHDLGALEDGSPYLVMERLVGETLHVRLARQKLLAFDEAIDIVIQVLSALVVAHEKGIVHRDIKPENVFLTQRVGCAPLVKVLDFGISKVIAARLGDVREESRLTMPGMVMGTLSYMSLEQARGDRNLDARVDLHACGVILYEALTGRRPFPASNIQALLLQLLSTNPVSASELRPGLPVGIDAVLDRAMARYRDDRYRTAHEMLRDLQALRERRNRSLVETGEIDAASDVRVPEATPSSLDIPIDFSETPRSGENLPNLSVPAVKGEDHDTEVTPLDRIPRSTRPHKVPER
jgi:serine/threonine-protein kinase